LSDILNAAITISAIDQASNVVRSIGSNISKALDALPGPAKAAVGAVAAVGATTIAVGVQSTKMAANYQAGISSLVTSAGEAKSNLKTVSDGMLGIAVEN
jgi:hypothetical protein